MREPASARLGNWKHALCDKCWESKFLRKPERLAIPAVEPCCGCGERTMSGIYLHGHPDKMPCKGRHGRRGTKWRLVDRRVKR